MMARSRRELRYAIVLAAVAVAGVVVGLVGARWGGAPAFDSGRYVRTARRMLGREVDIQTGIVAPNVRAHFPPLYPAVLALTSLGGADPLAMARWVHALLMAVNIFLAAELVRRFSSSISAAL